MGKWTGWVIGGVIVLVLIGVAVGDGGDEKRPTPRPAVSAPRDVRAAPAIPPRTNPTLTDFDQQCLRYVRLAEDVSMTERTVRADYATWRRVMVPACQELASKTKTACREMRNLGLDPLNPAARDGALAVSGLDEDASWNVGAAMVVWC